MWGKFGGKVGPEGPRLSPVGVDVMGAMLHQFMNTNLEILIDVGSPSTDRFQAADSLFGRIGHISDELAIN